MASLRDWINTTYPAEAQSIITHTRISAPPGMDIEAYLDLPAENFGTTPQIGMCFPFWVGREGVAYWTRLQAQGHS